LAACCDAASASATAAARTAVVDVRVMDFPHSSLSCERRRLQIGGSVVDS
jgi:hypothetical protein